MRWPSRKSPRQADLATLAATAGNPTVPPAWKENATALWQDALAQAKKEKAQWPYDWVSGVDYPHKEERANVTGQIVLNDPQAATTKLPHLTVGLAHPDYAGGGRTGRRRSRRQGGRLGARRQVLPVLERWHRGRQVHDHQCASRHVHAARLRRWRAGRIRAGQHHRQAGKNLDLGKIDWQPVRYGKQLWEIGYPDRTGDKFYKGDGDNYWLWGWCVRYGDLFPNDITYTIGKSDYRKDWFFEQVPHELSDAWKNPAAKDPLNQRFGWMKTAAAGERPVADHRPRPGDHMDDQVQHGSAAAQGQAALRIALAGADGDGGLAVAVNGQERRQPSGLRRPTPCATTPTRACGRNRR